MHECIAVLVPVRADDARGVSGEVGGRERRAGIVAVPDDQPRGLALVEVARAGVPEPCEGLVEGAEPNRRRRSVPARRGGVPSGEVDPGGLGKPGERRRFAGNPERRVPVDGHPSLRKLDRRGDRIAPGPCPEAFERRRMTGDEAGRRERERAEHVAVLHHGRPTEKVRVHPIRERVRGRVDTARRAHAELHRVRPALRRDVDDHEATAAESAHPRLDRTERESRRHRCIDRVAARFEHPGADGRREMVLAGDDPAGRANLRLANGPALVCRMDDGWGHDDPRWDGRDCTGPGPGRGSASRCKARAERGLRLLSMSDGQAAD